MQYCRFSHADIDGFLPVNDVLYIIYQLLLFAAALLVLHMLSQIGLDIPTCIVFLLRKKTKEFSSILSLLKSLNSKIIGWLLMQ